MTKEQDDTEEDDLSDLDLSDENSWENTEESVPDTHEELVAEEEQGEEEHSSSEEDEPSSKVSVQDQPVGAPPTSPIDLQSLPVNVILELGQLHMTMDQLLKLEPGNLLDVTLHPENGVDLTVNGKIVGKGELVRFGSAIGVRILQLGRHA